MTRRWVHTNLLPVPFVAASGKQTKDLFLTAWGDTQFLLVKLDNVASELTQGLTTASTLTSERLMPTRDSLAFATNMGTSIGLLAKVKAHSMGASGGSRAYDRTTLDTQLLRTPHFIVPLRKRPVAGKPFVDRISVGRAVNNDIVLRHGAVSKFHAWLECDEARNFYICDARSSNGTTVNGSSVGSNPLELSPGDEIRFGEVTATICPPELLWEVMTG